MGRFDWDGVNLAELYFESLEGHDNPARFTPMNDDVRAEFQADVAGFDPLELFKPATPGRDVDARQVSRFPRRPGPPPAGRMDRRRSRTIRATKP